MVKANIYCLDCLFMENDRCIRDDCLPAATPFTPRGPRFAAKRVPL